MESSEFLKQSKNNISQVAFFPSSQILSESMRMAIFTNVFILTLFLAILGIVTNLVNMVVFWRLGFSAVSNISFFSLSVSDLFCAVFMIIMQVGNHPMLSTTLSWEMAVIANPVFYLFSAFGSWITAVINMERCCCIVLPMKVKMIFTRTTVSVLLLGMVLYQTATVAPHYYAIGVGFASRFSPAPSKPGFAAMMNQTREVTYPSRRTIRYDRNIGIISLLLSFSIPTCLCFILVVLGTVFLLIGLERSVQFRRSTASTGNVEEKSGKETRIARTVLAVCVLYIVCYFPSFAIIVIPALFPAFSRFDPIFGNIVSTFFVFSTFFQAVSGTLNIFIYFVMSGQYNATFKKLFFKK